MVSFWGWLRPSNAMIAASRPATGPEIADTRAFYAVLDAYYRNNDLYNNLRSLAIANVIDSDTLMGLRNPTNRIVEFYAKKLWPGPLDAALTIAGPKDPVIAAIKQVQKDSNFAAMKQVLARESPLYGDFFLQVATRNDAGTGLAKTVYIHRVDPMYVTDFEEDGRKFAIRVRLDIPQEEVTIGDAIRRSTRTEVWDKVRYQRWVHMLGDYAPIEQVAAQGTLEADTPLSVWGIDFVPFVRAPFRDIGDTRGVSAIQHALDKIDDLNRSATRLHAMLFRHNKNTTIVESAARDQAGRLLTALDLGDEEDSAGRPVIKVGDEELWSLPGGYTLNSMVPKLAYADALAILEAAAREVEDDCPEMAYYRTRDMGDQLSGVALRLKLGPAIDNVTEARGNAYAALVRAHQMALTIGVNVGVFDRSLGTYENGDFDHTFIDRPVIALTELEEALVAKAKQDAGVPRRQTLIEQGYTETQVDEWEQERAQAADQQLAQLQVQRQQFALTQDQAAQQDGGTAGIRDRIQRSGSPPGTPANA